MACFSWRVSAFVKFTLFSNSTISLRSAQPYDEFQLWSFRDAEPQRFSSLNNAVEDRFTVIGKLGGRDFHIPKIPILGIY